MVEWITILSLILIGLALVVVEIIFVPGTTIVGLGGFVFMAVGVALSFRYFGSATGWTTAGSTLVVSGVFLYYSFKTNVWKRFSLKSTIDSKVNEGAMASVAPGAEGVALSALRPSGKAELLSKTFEVRTNGGYVEPGTKIRVTRVQENQIIVEPIS